MNKVSLLVYCEPVRSLRRSCSSAYRFMDMDLAPTHRKSIYYKDLIVQYPGAENADEVTVNGGGKIYYNGIGTIRQKVKFALGGKAGDVMIWELKQDSRDGKSLLGAIHAVIKE